MMASAKLGADAMKSADLMQMLPPMSVSALGFAIACGADVFLTIRHLAFVRLMLGYSATYKAAISSVGKRKWQILAVGAFYYAAFIIWVVIWVCIAVMTLAGYSVLSWPVTLLCGLVETIGAVVSLYAIFISYPLVLAVIGCEELPLGQTISRAHNLAFVNKSRAIGFLSMVTVTYFIMYLVLTTPVQGLYLFEYIRNAIETGKVDHDTPTPLYLEALNCVYYSLINMIVVPICTVSAGLFYRDITMREEGADLVQQIQQVNRLSPVER